VTKSQAARRSASAQKFSSDDSALLPSEIRSRANRAEFLLAGKGDLLRTATLTGSVHFEQTGPQPLQGDAGRVILDFAGRNQLQKVHAVDSVRLTQNAANKPAARNIAAVSQDFELSASGVDFTVADGHILQHAVTSGAGQIVLAQAPETARASAQTSPAQRTVVTAGQFQAQFASDGGGRNHLANVHGAPNSRIVSSTPGQPDRVSTSDSVDAAFLPQGGIDFITQQGHIVYTDGQQPDKRLQAWADSGRYTPTDQMLVLSGSPRIANGGMATTAKAIHINRSTGDALADGGVKSTYSELKEQPDGALLASSSPIHVTASTMTAHNTPGVVRYSGNARLWQDANIIEAPTIQFDRDRRFVTAQGSPTQPAQTILVQAEKRVPAGSANGDKDKGGNHPETGKISRTKPHNAPSLAASSPVAITAAKLTYADSERRVHYEGGVVAKGADFTASANTVDAYLLSRSQTASPQGFAGPGQLDHMVAQENVVIQQANRRADGQKLVYTVADDSFVLTGGPPSIFDAEQGKITGVSLTFFRRDDRVLVEGGTSTPVVTQTRVAH
jgi:lipopolysaccharide export system protein LptA